MIAVATLMCAAIIGLTTIKRLQAHSRRQGAGHVASMRSVGQRSRPFTRTPAPRGIRARVASIFAPGCLLPHVEPFTITPSLLIQLDTAGKVLGAAWPDAPGVPSARQLPRPTYLLAYARAERDSCTALPA
jgi:hypothetical protein